MSKQTKNVSRRSFVKTVGASMAIAATPALVRSQSKPRVVIVGGGFGGATAAKYIRLWSAGSIDVTLIDRRPAHYSCILSNLILSEQLRLKNLKFSYTDLAQRYGVNVIRGNVKNIDGAGATILLADGAIVAYDRLVLATGVGFDKIPGWKTGKVPHAWIAGGQTNLLRNQLRAMPDDGTVVMTIPKAPFRCPPGPYERACTIAAVLGERSGVIGGTPTGGTPRVVILDANDGIQASKEIFTNAYQGIYKDIIEYHTNVDLQAVDSDFRVAITSAGDFQADVLNVIPRHRAPWLTRKSRLVTGGDRWAAVNPLTYESTNPGFPGVHVIGDSQGTGQPKSGHMANSQAKVCADAIVRFFNGSAVDSEERINNIRTNSACYSPITHNQAAWLTAVFQYNTDTGQMELSPGSLGTARNWTRDSFEKMFAWSDNLFADTFM